MTPSRQYYHLQIQMPKEVTSGIDAWLDHSYGYWTRRWGKKQQLYSTAKAVARKSDKLRSLTDEALKEALLEQKIHFRRKKDLTLKDYQKAIAYVGVAAERTMGMHPYPVQYMGALTVLTDNLAEMATGEGKTLTTALAATLMGWTGNPVHVLTANDYLAQRDAEEMMPLYQFCHVSAGYVVGQMEPLERKANYAQDITCTTSKELLADFLRDRLIAPGINNPIRILNRELLGQESNEQSTRVLRGIHTALVDEADSVLLDDASTPLIISQKYNNEAFTECCKIAHELSNQLEPGKHYQVDYKHRDIQLMKSGHQALDAYAHKLPRMWRSFDRSMELVKLSLTAREFFIKDKDYVIVDEKVVIVDPNTGRQKQDSTWRGGVHQAIEIKEDLPITDSAKTLASLTFQGFFRLFDKLGATTGTASSCSREFWHVYRLPVIKVPTHRPCKRAYARNRYVATLEDKWKVITEMTQAQHSAGRPVLIGTGSVDATQALEKYFTQAGLPCRVLNARSHEEEAEIVAQAGKPGAITIATNMAGRGTDIKLAEGVAELGGLHVIATDLMESKRIDRQLYGRSARQGDPGSAQTIVSMEDDLLRKVHNQTLLKQAGTALASKAPGSRVIAQSLALKSQRKIEKQNKLQRKAMLQTDKWLKESLAFTGGTGL